ncbi:MAG: 1-acyl-sn-glycerol-3-phosphate acyltransferase [Alphaproteobacteria bacterium]|nr:1-acyl-sn-glycerol-3-phosphate acyltransferase [Alphaproteobacteria bacterium]
MQLLFSMLFSLLINLWGAIVPLIFLLPSALFRSRKIADFGAKIWSKVSIWMLKKICGVDYKIIGAENILHEPCIFACKHQSMWETIIMHLIIKRPVYAYKKELELIPFYGWFLKVMSGIKVDRKGGAHSLKSVVNQAKYYLAHGQSIVIFPQGTRVGVGAKIDQYPYQSGISALYKACNVKVVPVALNSGIYWPKRGAIKKRGTILIEFLSAIDVGLPRHEFEKELTQIIEESSAKLAIDKIDVSIA